VDEHDVHVDLVKVQVIYDPHAPKKLELWNLLGLSNFYIRFTFGLSHNALPLIQVTKGGTMTKLVWVDAQ